MIVALIGQSFPLYSLHSQFTLICILFEIGQQLREVNLHYIVFVSATVLSHFFFFAVIFVLCLAMNTSSAHTDSVRITTMHMTDEPFLLPGTTKRMSSQMEIMRGNIMANE